MDINTNFQKEKHQNRIEQQANIRQHFRKLALKNYNKQGRLGINRDPKLCEFNFELLKPFYIQLKDPFTGHWMKQIPKNYIKEKKLQKQEQDLHQLL
ncbi:unnamed protein product (macronuclear) [Paramecium tetraurelia]|uniref:Uncharacterized protein n=1 Tax=Paramecium tetraurelia TaxID=5888 RepID=A0CHY0_PARTE|nr:uncharacterized protein GSPATT00038499001 [Paramecium tetraurelia]CAK70397.1 unnamed protein product [Paramecium tetraurelia]|eukprot:XP_001437794.1 hypothetical protein (macronuclear) [Paramecium tetraurelia strain d4-2]